MSGSDVVSDAVIAGSGSGELEDAIRDSKRKKRNRDSAFDSPTPVGVCSNCGTKLAGPVCHSCGQTADSFHRPVWDLIMEVLDGLLGIEGRLWRTVPPLVFRPGWLTRQYLSGVRARFVLPFRLYLTASVLFFLLMFSVNNFQPDSAPEIDPVIVEETQKGLDQAQEELEGMREELESAGIPSGVAAMMEEQAQRGIEAASEEVEATANDAEAEAARNEAFRRETIDTLCATLTPEDCPEATEMLEQADQDPNEEGLQLEDGVSINLAGSEELPLEVRRFLRQNTENVIEDNGQRLMEDFQRWIPRVMFVMLPIYALLLAVTHFYKRGYFYYDHLVVSLHFHAFLFFLFILMMGLSQLIGIGASLLILFIWSNYYLYRIHRLVYSHGRFSSILRTIFMDFAYLFFLILGAGVAMFIAFMAQSN